MSDAEMLGAVIDRESFVDHNCYAHVRGGQAIPDFNLAKYIYKFAK